LKDNLLTKIGHHFKLCGGELVEDVTLLEIVYNNAHSNNPLI